MCILHFCSEQSTRTGTLQRTELECTSIAKLKDIGLKEMLRKMELDKLC